MRLRLPELLKVRGLTRYALAARSGGRISPTFAYRLVNANGDFKCLTPVILEALCDVLGVEPADLFERGTPKKRKH